MLVLLQGNSFSLKSKLVFVPRSLMMSYGPSCFLPFPGAHSRLIDKMCCMQVGICTIFWAKVHTSVMLKHWVLITFIDEDPKVWVVQWHPVTTRLSECQQMLELFVSPDMK